MKPLNMLRFQLGPKADTLKRLAVGDASALMTTNKRLESQLSASEALIRPLKAEADKHRKV